MSDSGKSLVQVCAAAATRLLRPFVRMLIRNGIPFRTAADWMRWIYVDVAMREFQLPGRAPSQSRVAVLTGLSRVDVHRLSNQLPPGENVADREYHRAARVLTGWGRHKRYQGPDGKPLKLPFEGEDPSFTELARSFSGGAPPRSVLDELVRVNAVRKDDDGKLELLTLQYIPETGKELPTQIDILGRAAGSLIDTIDHNIAMSDEETFLQASAANNRIPASRLADVARHIKSRGRELLYEIDDYLYQQAIDEDEDSDNDLIEAGIGIYFFRNSDTDR